MHDEHDRYTRQRRLREIGDAGQERLESAVTTIAGGPGAVIELVYLHRAGIGSVAIDALATPRVFPHASVLRHPAARRFAASSWRALRAIVEISGADRQGASS
jgi:hypothetical protein